MQNNNYTEITASSMKIESLGKLIYFPKTLSSSTFIKYIQLNMLKNKSKIALNLKLKSFLLVLFSKQIFLS